MICNLKGTKQGDDFAGPSNLTGVMFNHHRGDGVSALR